MKHIQRNLWLVGVAAALLIGVAYALEGIGLAAIAAVGVIVVAALVIPPLVVFEEETHLPPFAHRDYRH